MLIKKDLEWLKNWENGRIFIFPSIIFGVQQESVLIEEDLDRFLPYLRQNCGAIDGVNLQIFNDHCSFVDNNTAFIDRPDWPYQRLTRRFLYKLNFDDVLAVYYDEDRITYVFIRCDYQRNE